MKPILYDANETDFTTQGIGVLYDCIKMTVTEELNGSYEAEFKYPTTGQHFYEIKHSSIIKVVPFENGSPQLFRVYKISEPISGQCVINCEHISYQLNHIPCAPFKATSAREALEGFKTNAWEACPFEFTTDKGVNATYEQKIPESIRARLGGQEGSILDVYGGEFEFDNYDVILHTKRGTSRNVTLRYGKNITDILQEENIEKTITGVCPYWTSIDRNDDGTETTNIVTLPEHVIHVEASENFPYQRTTTIDFSSDFEEQPTVDQLRARAKKYVEDNNIGVPSVNIEVSFVALWGTEEYKDIAPLERVYLGDTIQVEFEPLGISATARVIKTVWNPLLERYDSIQLGDAKASFARTIADAISNTEKELDDTIKETIPSVMDNVNREIERNNQLIMGGLGGYVVMTANANGQPEEILIMDSDSTANAKNVIRLNKNGIGFSTSGYEGPYSTAWTIDGHFNADYITAGTLTAALIKAGLLSDNAGLNWWNMETGAFSFANGNMTFNPKNNYIDLLNSYTFRFNGVSLAGEVIYIDLEEQGDLIIEGAEYLTDSSDQGFSYGYFVQFPYFTVVNFWLTTVKTGIPSGTTLTIKGLPLPHKYYGGFLLGTSVGVDYRTVDSGTSYSRGFAWVHPKVVDADYSTQYGALEIYSPAFSNNKNIMANFVYISEPQKVVRSS